MREQLFHNKQAVSGIELLDNEVYSPFYANYLDYETFNTSSKDPHERLTSFHLAILELVSSGKKDLAYEVYQDLIAKKDLLEEKKYPFQEELNDLKRDIIETLQSCKLNASFSDLQ